MYYAASPTGAQYSAPTDVTATWKNSVAQARSISPTRNYAAGGAGSVVSPTPSAGAPTPYDHWRSRPVAHTPTSPVAPVRYAEPQQAYVQVQEAPQVHHALSPPQSVGRLPQPQPLPNVIHPDTPIFNGQEVTVYGAASPSYEAPPSTAAPASSVQGQRRGSTEEVTIYKNAGEPLGLDLEDLHVAGVRSGSPVQRMGLEQAVVGKEISRMEQEEVRSPEDIFRISPTLSPKTKVTLTVSKEAGVLPSQRAGSVAAPDSYRSQRQDQLHPHLVQETPPQAHLQSAAASPQAPPGMSPMLDPSDRVVAPTTSPYYVDPSAAIDDSRDPRNGLKFVQVPNGHAEAFTKLKRDSKEAVMYFFGDVTKVNRKGGNDPRVLIVVDNAAYLCMRNGKLARSVPIEHFVACKLGRDDKRIGFKLLTENPNMPATTQSGGTPPAPQHDMLLEMESTARAKELAEIVQTLVQSRGGRFKIDADNASVKLKDLSLHKDSSWTKAQQKTLPFTDRGTVLATARNRASRRAGSQSPQQTSQSPQRS